MMINTLHLRILILSFALVLISGVASADGLLTYGSKVLSHDIDEGLGLSPFYVGPVFAFVDLNNNGMFEPEDPVYIHIDPGGTTVSKNDVRLTAFSSLPAGSQVRADDPDHGKDLKRFGSGHSPAAELRYFDVDGDKAYSLNDPVYLDLTPGIVSAGDIRVTGYKDYPPGSRVIDSDVDSDKPTMTLPGMLSFYNSDGDINNGGWAIYDEGDIIYMDTQYPFNLITVNDIRL